MKRNLEEKDQEMLSTTGASSMMGEAQRDEYFELLKNIHEGVKRYFCCGNNFCRAN